MHSTPTEKHFPFPTPKTAAKMWSLVPVSDNVRYLLRNWPSSRLVNPVKGGARVMHQLKFDGEMMISWCWKIRLRCTSMMRSMGVTKVAPNATKSIWRIQSTASCFFSLTFHGISFTPVSFPPLFPLPSALQIHALLSSNNCCNSSLFSIRLVPILGGHSSFLNFSPSIKKATVSLMSSIHAFI